MDKSWSRQGNNLFLHYYNKMNITKRSDKLIFVFDMVDKQNSIIVIAIHLMTVANAVSKPVPIIDFV